MATDADLETLICLHCSGSSGRQWEGTAATLAGKFDVLTPELIGYASGQRWALGQTASFDDEAEHLAPLLDAGGAHLFGHSYGGAVALQIALRWPDRVKSLTLYEPVRFALLFGGPATDTAAREITSVARRIELDLLDGEPAAAAARFADYWSGTGAWAGMSARRQQNLADRMPKVAAEFEAAFGDTLPPSAYRRLTMPVHLIGGTRSPRPARQVLDALAALVPGATRSALTGLGHMGPLEDPCWVTSVFEALVIEGAMTEAAA